MTALVSCNRNVSANKELYKSSRLTTLKYVRHDFLTDKKQKYRKADAKKKRRKRKVQ